MNRYVEHKWSWIDGAHGMRDGLLERLTDDELRYSPGGQNPTLGEVMRQMGEVERSYIDALQTFVQTWDYRNGESGLSGNVVRLAAWFRDLDDELRAVVTAFDDDELGQQVVRQDTGMRVPVKLLLDVYVQAMMIFFGKVIVYFRAMDKPLPPSVQQWIE